MTSTQSNIQHAALWLIGPDMPGLLRLGAKFVADRGGNIDKAMQHLNEYIPKGDSRREKAEKELVPIFKQAADRLAQSRRYHAAKATLLVCQEMAPNDQEIQEKLMRVEAAYEEEP